MSKALVVTNPMPTHNRSPLVSLNKFLSILCKEYDRVILITAGRDENISLFNNKKLIVCKVSYTGRGPRIKKIFDHIRIQLEYSWQIIRFSRQINCVFFWIADKQIIPFCVAKIIGLKTVFFFYGLLIREGNRKKFSAALSSYIELLTLPLTDYVGVESSAVVTHLGIEKYWSKVRIIHLYVDFDLFKYVRKQNERANIMGMVGRIAPGKRVLESIEAFHDLREKYPDWQLEILGSGPIEIECRQLIRNLCEEDRIHMLGWVDYYSIGEYMNRWKFAILPSDTEGLPNTLIECMACGTPVLATPVGGIPDIIQDGINGRLLPDNCVETIREYLVKMIETANIASIADYAERFCRSKYSFESSAENLMQVLRTMV